MAKHNRDPNMVLDVIVRPLDRDKIAIALCSDGLGHAFALKANGEPEDAPACHRDVGIVGPAKDESEVCESCFAAGQSWAQGGLLKVVSDAPVPV